MTGGEKKGDDSFCISSGKTKNIPGPDLALIFKVFIIKVTEKVNILGN